MLCTLLLLTALGADNFALVGAEPLDFSLVCAVPRDFTPAVAKRRADLSDEVPVIVVPEDPNFHCEHCDRLKAYLTSIGQPFRVEPGPGQNYPRFKFKGKLVVGNDTPRINELLGITLAPPPPKPAGFVPKVACRCGIAGGCPGGCRCGCKEPAGKEKFIQPEDNRRVEMQRTNERIVMRSASSCSSGNCGSTRRGLFGRRR